MVKIYFGAAPLIITTDLKELQTIGLKGATQIINPAINEVINLLNHLKKTPEAAIIQTDNVDAVFSVLKAEFTVLQAAGGLAYTPNEQVLLIFRRGKWDLPKGKLDEGETLEMCAIREVEEETGLHNITLGNKLQVTYHTYQEKGKHILKASHWYLMTVPAALPLTPQTEEDIQECIWVQKDALSDYINNAHPSVADVLKNWLAVY